MDKQNYRYKSFVISIKSHEEETSSCYIPYEFICDDEKWQESVVAKLLSNSFWFVNKDCKSINKIIESEGDVTNKSALYKVRIVVHSHQDFSIGQVSYEDDVASFAQDVFFPNPKKGEVDEPYLPIIHLTLDNSYVDNLYSEINIPLPSHISRSYQILDSSIWNKIVPFDRNNEYKVGGAIGLYNAIREIELNYRRGLYSLEVTHEYANLNARLAKQAFLSGTHANGVSPFIFHSESAIKRLAAKEFNIPPIRNKEVLPVTEKIQNQKWRILLVDDKASNGLSPKGKVKLERTSGDLPWNSKLAIIIDLLKSHFTKSSSSFVITYRELNGAIHQNFKSSKDDHDENNGILIEFAENIENAKKSLREKKYDLILLDYLLDKESKAEYGYELLDLIFREIEESKDVNGAINYNKVSYKIGPHKRLFFIFISAYTNAVYERLLAEGLNRSEKYWHIAVGACPTNTPQLFLYNLLKLMEKQLEDSGVDKLSAKGIYDVVNKIYGETDKVRSRANEKYQDVLDLHYLYRKMLKDVEIPQDSIFNTKGSVLITNFITKNVNLGGLLEHLTQLVHLTAFGTVRQWPEMWEEYIYFKSQFDLNQFKNEIGSGDAKKLFDELCIKIESYILKLKSDIR